jgi:hypothetical protein
MQAFLPYPDFARSAKALDRQRLGKQRVECLQIFAALTTPGHGYRNHPVVKMWLGYEPALAAYTFAICTEWIARGYKDTCREKIMDAYGEWCDENDYVVFDLSDPASIPMPPWFGNAAFHESHRANLKRKNPAHYSRMLEFELVDPRLDYIWPVSDVA